MPVLRMLHSPNLTGGRLGSQFELLLMPAADHNIWCEDEEFSLPGVSEKFSYWHVRTSRTLCPWLYGGAAEVNLRNTNTTARVLHLVFQNSAAKSGVRGRCISYPASPGLFPRLRLDPCRMIPVWHCRKPMWQKLNTRMSSTLYVRGSSTTWSWLKQRS